MSSSACRTPAWKAIPTVPPAPSTRATRLATALHGPQRGLAFGDLGVVAGGSHAEHLRRHAEVGVHAEPWLGVGSEDALGQVGLGVERAADPHHVGLARVEDAGDLFRRADAADRENGDRHPRLGGAEDLAVPYRREAVAGRAEHVAGGDEAPAPE